MKRTCPDNEKGCGMEKPLNSSNFRMRRKKLDTGRTVVRYDTYCLDCENKQRRDKRKKQLQGYKLREMDCIPEMSKFLYGG